MARITGKNGKLRGELSRTTVSTPQAMTNTGDNQNYTFQSFWNPNLPPRIFKNAVEVARTAYTVDFIAGKVTFITPNLVTDAITVNDIEYSTLQNVGDIFNWTLDAKIDVMAATAFQDQFREQLSGFRNWNATAEAYHLSGFWFDAFSLAKPFYVELFPDANSLERWVGAAFVDFSKKVAFDSPVTETITLNGTGALQRLTT